MRTSFRYLIVTLAVTVMFMGMAIPAIAGGEGTLFSRINSSRSASGLAPLETYWDLTDDARAHSARMMDRGSIYHNPSLASVTGVWEKLGENVGAGIDLNALHDAFMGSSGHRANILGDYNYVGVGVKTDSAGVSWVTVVFMKAAPGLNGGTTTTTQAPATTTTTQAPAPPPAPAPAPVPEPVTTTTKAPTTTKTPATATTKAPAKAATSTQSSALDASNPSNADRPLHPRSLPRTGDWRFFIL
jgi:hypothetical protein